VFLNQSASIRSYVTLIVIGIRTPENARKYLSVDKRRHVKRITTGIPSLANALETVLQFKRKFASLGLHGMLSGVAVSHSRCAIKAKLVRRDTIGTGISANVPLYQL